MRDPRTKADSWTGKAGAGMFSVDTKVGGNGSFVRIRGVLLQRQILIMDPYQSAIKRIIAWRQVLLDRCR